MSVVAFAFQIRGSCQLQLELGHQADHMRPNHSHEYQKLPLIPVEEFLAKHHEHSEADENALMVARIEDERREREALEQQRQELLKRKQKLIAENKKRREDLANLDNDLEKFIDVRSSFALSST